uniref:UPAR/Ly6 domain-containing protein n=1 Tax=Xiphophorus couchianus TaxID=32473 RepID=A0A3B5MB32_9TELE
LGREFYGAKIERNSKGCIISELCISYSVNFGAERIVQNTKCCSEDLCNNNYLCILEYNSTTNGKKCFSCDGENCMKTLNCAGDENYCIKVTAGVSLTLKGCASESVCSDRAASLVNQITGSNISCCQSDYCNGASSTSINYHLFALPLFYNIIHFIYLCIYILIMCFECLEVL